MVSAGCSSSAESLDGHVIMGELPSRYDFFDSSSFKRESSSPHHLQSFSRSSTVLTA